MPKKEMTPDYVTLTRDELKKALRNELIEEANDIRDSFSEDMEAVNRLNSLALDSSDPAASAFYMTLAAELQDSVSERMNIQIQERMIDVLSHHLKVEWPVKEYNCVMVKKEGLFDPDKVFILRDENLNPVSEDEFESLSREIREEMNAAISSKRENDIQIYDKSIRESNTKDLPVEWNFSNSCQKKAAEKDINKYREIIKERNTNLRKICKSVLNGENFPSLSDLEEHNRAERTYETMAYLCEKARDSLELCNGGKDIPAGINLSKNQQEMLTAIITNSEEEPDNINRKLYNLFTAAHDKKQLPKNLEVKVDGKSTAPVGLVISCDMDDDIESSEFISNYKNNDLSRSEITWACRQFDKWAERTGANIRGMLVNGKPVLDLSLNGTADFENKAKCALISAALDGQRISAVPVHENGMPDSRKTPTPVRVLDTLEQTKSLWERILEFFGLGRSNRMKESNNLGSAKREHDAEKLSDVRYVPLEMSEKLLKETKPDPNFENMAQQLNDKAKQVVEDSKAILSQNCMQFLSGMFPGKDVSDLSEYCDKVNSMVSYTGENGKRSSYLATLFRDGSLTHFLYMYGITKGHTLDEMLFSKDLDRAAIGRDFIEKFSIKSLDEFAGEKNLDVSSEETRKTYNDYVLGKKQDVVKLSTEMFEALKRQSFTPPDPADPDKLLDNYIRQKAFFQMVGDFEQVFANMRDNDLNPSDKSAQAEVDRTNAINNYEYYKLNPIQSYASAYYKYVDYLSSDYMNDRDPENEEISLQMDMAVRSKAFLETAAEWKKNHSTWGDVVNDKKLPNYITSLGSASVGEDSQYNAKLMDTLSERYLRTTGKGFDYIRCDVDHYGMSRLGMWSNNRDTIEIEEKTRADCANEMKKYFPDGFESNLESAFDKLYGKENSKKQKAPVREKMGFDELVGKSERRISRPSVSNEKQLENEKSKGSMGKA